MSRDLNKVPAGTQALKKLATVAGTRYNRGMGEPKIPEKWSDRLELAVRDSQACEARRDLYTLNMWQWHGGTDQSRRCSVCMAGAVMAQTFKVSREKYYSPQKFASDTEDFFLGIDSLRQFEVPDFESGEVGGVLFEQILDRHSHHYDPMIGRAPWDVYLTVAAELRAVGL